ncbi:MAG: hypothetical protein RLZZ504_268 [Bacteroidota bacterium]|jgi:hypothetical protein
MEGARRFRNLGIFALFLISFALRAQHFAPIAVGNYSGVHAAKVNPALTAQSPYKWHVNIIGAWANVNNNYINLQLPYSAYHTLFNTMPDQYKTVNGNPRFDSAFLYEDLNRKRKFAGLGAMAYMPSVLFQYKKVHIGWLNDAVVLGRVSGINEPLAYAFKRELSYNKRAFNYFILDKNNNFNLDRSAASVNAYVSSGINVSFSRDLPWKQKMMFGATLKKVWGLGGAYAKWDDMQVHKVSQNIVNFDKTNIHYALYQGRGRGTAMDLGWGMIYHKPDYKQNGDYLKKHKQYRYKFGLSLLDLGSVRYDNVQATDIVNATTTTWDATGFRDQLIAADPNAITLAPINGIFQSVSGYSTDTRTENIGLPTRFIASVDYQYSKRVFINYQVMQSLRGRFTQHMRYQSYAMIAPRYEKQKWEVSVPILLEYDYRSLRAGFALRAGCFYIGSNSALNFLYTRNVRDADIYFGFTISQLKGTKNDWFIRRRKEAAEQKDNKKPDCEKM